MENTWCMKKIQCVLLLFLVSEFVLADAHYSVRNSCNGYLFWQYKTYAAVKKSGGAWNHVAVHSCVNDSALAERNGYRIIEAGGVYQKLAGARAVAGPARQQASVFIEPGYSTAWSAGGNTDQYVATGNNAPMYELPDTIRPHAKLQTIATISTGQIVFDSAEHAIVLHDLQATLQVNDPDMANTYVTCKIFVYDCGTAKTEQDGEDGILISSMQAMLLNGKLVLQGGLETREVSKSQSSSYIIKNTYKIISIDKAVALENLVIKLGVDAGNIENGIPENYRLQNEMPVLNNAELQRINSPFNLFVRENPVAAQLRCDFSNGTRIFSDVALVLYNASGNPVKNIYNGPVLEAHGREFRTDVSDLTSGVYYLSAITNTGEKFSRKVVKN